ncbi:MAG: exodeoxyribonuclease I [Pseudomonadales bacterium]|jgi:exodeoxyribonuclease-1|nr:exodeoxyribonuclease I [Pseudomonadales bacterium]MDP6470920.1 exodeoxyribonuclease I [Pseudomonadales bacterium]MDP6825895.1 exodeoxyribonuclease I [Pseudomonadales bacterium]MDP6972863.1 exodeoxyribonuclease I [Pseudomonadales bacterium]|tara:strand:+ start:3116 stop:4510 length:1395 start_codon:yes stop_codon:yes gene_type:complete
MAQSFYWYDLETSGTQPRWDRIVQFAGFRTDLELNDIGEQYCTYVRLPDEVLPDPDAAVVTRITPQMTREEGISEWQALTRVNELFAIPGTCVAGYNSLRFDDEFIRFGLYRSLMDPYAREWQNGNSRWDLIDLVRATGALRRDGIKWPVDEEGLPVYRLEALSEANGLEHGQAHDALSDVRATVALARLIRDKQPRLFDFYFHNRFKKHPRSLLEPYGARLCVHVSGMYPRSRYGVAPVMSMCRHPTNSNAIVVVDLAKDVECLLRWSAEEICEALFSTDASERPPLKELRINRCPFVAGIEVLTGENLERLDIDLRVVKQRHRAMRTPGLAEKIQQVYRMDAHPGAADVDAALYDGFLQDADRSRCQTLQDHLRAGAWLDLDYQDQRLVELAPRLKAQSFPELMSDAERAAQHERVAQKLNAEDAQWRTLEVFEARLAGLQTDAVTSALAEYGRQLRTRYPV